MKPKTIWTIRPFSKIKDWKGDYKAERYHHGEIVYPFKPGSKKGEPPK